METELTEIWVYLSGSPLAGLTMTLVAYGLAYRLYNLSGGFPLLNPVVTAVAMIMLFLWLTQTRYQDYFEGAQFIHFLLGPATVALAVPLYDQLPRLKRLLLPISLTLVAGVLVNVGSVLGIAWLLGADDRTLLSLAPKSVTAPVGMGISEYIGGIPSLTAVLVVATGIIGAMIGTRVFKLMNIRDDAVQGIAMGISAHGIGTARAFQVSSQMGAFSGLAMALSALVTSLMLPPLIAWLGFSASG